MTDQFDPDREAFMMYRRCQRRHSFAILLLAIILVLCYGFGDVFGQEAGDVGHPAFVDGVEIPKGVGFQGPVPTFLCLIKAGVGHSGEVVGTGSWLTGRLVLTSYSNVRGLPRGKGPTVHCVDGTEHTDTTVVHKSARLDLALIYVNGGSIPDHDVLTVESDIYPLSVIASIGWNPDVWGICLYPGKTNGKQYGNRWRDRRVWFGHTCKVVQGMSGGPVIDRSFNLVGVNHAVADGDEFQASNLSRVQSFLDSYKGPTGRLSLPE